ncbi:MAG TPA: cyanophycinase [Salinisphaeraceae bacterium]|nr:cyanophycinase [Salinisphaeraceae bacterium]
MVLSSVDSRGCLVAIGGAEDKTCASDVLSAVVALAPEQKKEITVIAAASSIPNEVLPTYEQVFAQLGAERVHLLAMRARGDAEDAQSLSAVAASSVIFFTGGDQLRLTNLLGGSRLLQAIQARFMAGAVVAGTSAGAMVLATTMIYNGDAANALHKGAVNMSSGLGFVGGLIIDTHFLARGRFTRLMAAGATNPQDLGVGLDENTAVIVHPNRVLEAVGPEHVILLDSRGLVRSNIAELSAGNAVAIENMTMHALISGHGYDIDQRRYLVPDELQTKMGLGRTA